MVAPSRDSESHRSNPTSKGVSPHQGATQRGQAAFQAYHYRSLETKNIFKKGSSKRTPNKLTLKKCDRSASIDASSLNNSTAKKNRSQKKSFKFSGDLNGTDSPKSTGSPVMAVSNRMASLTNTEKQFIRRVNFDKNLQDVFARKNNHSGNNTDVTAGFDVSNLHTSNR